MHHLVFGLRSDRARRARRSRWPPTGARGACARPRCRRQPRRARVRVAVDRGPRRRRHRRRDPARRRTTRTSSTCSSTSGRTPRSCSGTASGCSPPRARPAPRSRARRSRAASGPRPARSSASGSTRHPRASVPHRRQRRVVRRARRAHPDGRLRLGHHRAGRRAVPRGDPHHRRRDRPRREGSHPARDRRRPHVRVRRARGRAPARAHAERRAPDPAGQGRAVRGLPPADGPLGIDHVDRIRLAGAFGAHIDPVHAMVLGLVPDCDPSR